MSRILLVTLGLCASSWLSGQSLWHFTSRLTQPWAGSARYMDTGGALSSLGNDPSAILDNPATAATYRAGEISLTGLYRQSIGGMVSQGAYLPAFHWGSAIEGTDGSIIAFSLDTRQSRFQPSPWSEYGTDIGTSQVQSWLAQAGNRSPDECFNEGLYGPYAAYQAYVLEYDGQNLYPIMLGDPSLRSMSFTRSSVQNQVQGSVAVRTNRISFGGALEYYQAKTKESTYISEYGYAQDSYLLTIASRQTDSAVSGGVRMRFGFLGRVGEGTRISGFLHAQSLATTRWHYRYRIMPGPSNPNGVGVEPFELYQDENLKLIQPGSGGMGIAQVFGSSGFLSAEYRFTPAPKRPIQSPLSFMGIGEEIAAELKAQHDMRIGAEWRQDAISFRAGIHHASRASHFVEHSGFTQFSMGMGVRNAQSFFDIALSTQFRQGKIIHPLEGYVWNLPAQEWMLVATYSVRLR